MLNEDQVNEAIVQMISTCDLKMAPGQYESCSARSVLNELGYHEDADQVIRHIAEGGFTNCLDPIIPTKSYPDFKEEFPVYAVCFWGPDQLKSRLESLSNVPYWVRFGQANPARSS